ncbi:FHA domain-containing protein [Candidatus Woesearchaeota archaeon]|nr:FHA domain-containing protein [Candidatus Woesearchaeota archaeon]
MALLGLFSRKRAELIIVSGPLRRVFPLYEDTVYIGRDPNYQPEGINEKTLIVKEGPEIKFTGHFALFRSISRERKIELRWDRHQRRYLLEDKGRIKIAVNGVIPTSPVAVQPNDHLALGDIKFQILY